MGQASLAVTRTPDPSSSGPPSSGPSSSDPSPSDPPASDLPASGRPGQSVPSCLSGLFEGPGGLARLAFWQEVTKGARAGDPALERRLAEDILACRGQITAAALLAARAPMLARAGSALRAGGGAAAGPSGDVTLLATDRPFRGFFAVESLILTHRRHYGGVSAPMRREVFVACDAVTVLPYDPARDRVLLIEQFRAGPVARGDAAPWQIEAIAGRIDGADTPEDTARREAREEAGLDLGALLPVAAYYPSPGAVTEYIHSFVALADLPDGTGGLHGLADEHEDILARVLPFDEALDLLSRGRIGNAPLILTLLWLQRERPRLRAEAAG